MLNLSARAPWRVLFVFALVALLSLALVGCSDDDNPVIVPECEDPDVLRFPPSPDQLMANFKVAHEAMSAEAYMALLDPSFEMYLQPGTQLEFPAVGATLDYAEESVIAERMFSGEAITNSNGDLVPGVSGINFLLFEQQNAWATATPETGFPGTQAALFEVMFLWDRQGNSTLRVEGLVKMYAAEHDSVVCGVDVTYYRLAGMQDLTNGGKRAGVEQNSLGSVKALFW